MTELHDDLASAFEDVEKDNDSAPDPIIEASVDEEQAPKVKDEAVVQPVQEGQSEGARKEQEAPTGTAQEREESADIVAPPPVEPVAKSFKAPVHMTPAQREQWSKVPVELQESITARENEMAGNLANTSDSRKTHDRMSALGQSFAPILAAEGLSDPVQAAEGLFKTVSQLRMGTQEQKAQTIAGMIKHYGIDISQLDSALVGEGNTQQTPEQTQMERMLEEKMAPFNKMQKMLEQAQTENTNQTQVRAQQSVQDFSKDAEFLGDVRNDMADMIDMAHSRGVEMPLQDAYNKAVAMNPEISKILEQRRITGSNNNLQAKKTAASTLSGRQTGVPGTKQDGSIRGALEAAFEGF